MAEATARRDSEFSRIDAALRKLMAEAASQGGGGMSLQLQTQELNRQRQQAADQYDAGMAWCAATYL